MKQFFKMFFASLLAIIIAGVIMVGFLIGSLIGLATKSNENKTKDNSVLVIDLQKRLHEQKQVNPFAIFTDDNGNAGLYDAMQAIKHAKTDDKIKGILIKLEGGSNGWATMQQLRMAIVDFKSSKKFVYAYGEDITQGAYYVGSAADSIYANPVGDVVLKGFATEMPFFKGTLEKLEVQPEIFYAGKFKSATEPFRADKMSDANKLQITVYQQSMWNEFMKAVTEHTGLDTATINRLTQTGAIQFPTDALNNKLVDGILYWDEVEQRIKSKTGQKENDAINYVSLSDYAESDKTDNAEASDRIAILYAEGTIKDGVQDDDLEVASKTFVDNIRKVRKNDKIKAVVLRVNSPGGSAAASEIILHELELLKQKKPLVVSMGDLAASGGYYIACHGDSIFAMPNTITGSIGVFSMLFSTEGLMKNKLGITFDGVKTAPYADFPTTARPLTEVEAQRMQHSVDKIYELFKGRVAAGRKLKPEDVDSIAQGRVWTGTDALKVGLVDAIGGLDRAIASAATLGKVKTYKVVSYPEPRDKIKDMLSKFSKNTEASAMLQATVKEQLGDDYEWLKQIKELRQLNGKVLMAMPFTINIR